MTMKPIGEALQRVAHNAAPKSVRAFATDTARAMDTRLERMAQSANAIANETRDQRWTNAALALLGARRTVRECMAAEDRSAAPSGSAAPQ